MGGAFHALDVPQGNETPQNTRIFVGDGTPFLPVPGLVGVQSVRVGNTPLPLSEKRQIPLDASLAQFATVEIPIVDLSLDGQGTPILRRSVMSNDGLWQKGERIYIGGEWAEEKTPETVPATVGRVVPDSVTPHASARKN